MLKRYLSTKTVNKFSWELSRAHWLVTGNPQYVHGPISGKSSPSDELIRLQLIAEEERAKRKPRSSRPVRVREHNILNAFREPQRMVEFNRPLPLPRMIELITQVWQEAQQTTAGNSISNMIVQSKNI